MAKAPRKQIFDLVGESQLNQDGSSRQKILRYAVPGQEVSLVREPDNSRDANAIFVTHTSSGRGIGYISRDNAADLASAIDSGLVFKARIHELTGGIPDYDNFGCRVCIVLEEKAFRESLPLRPEQVHYEHAPTWRTGDDKKVAPRTTSKIVKSGFAAKLIKLLLK